jgi:hypothetical protein
VPDVEVPVVDIEQSLDLGREERVLLLGDQLRRG